MRPHQIALIRSLLANHGVKDVHAMMQNVVSNDRASIGQIRRVRASMLAEGEPRRPSRALYEQRRARAPIAAEPTPARRYPAAPETFESQLARIAAGAQLIAAPDFRRPDHAFTLGGVGSALL